MPIANLPLGLGPRVGALAIALLVLAPSSIVLAQHLSEPAQNATAGAGVFGSRGCVGCHSIRGLGGRDGPDLAGVADRLSFYGLASAIWNHLPRSEGRADFRMGPRETGNLLAFLYTTSYFDPPGDLETGKRLFAGKNCILCHQVRGVGGVVGPDLDLVARYGSPISIAAAMWNHGPSMAEAMRERGIGRPGFTGSELLDLLSWLQSQSREFPQEPVYVLPGSAVRGRALFDGKACSRCHGAAGEGSMVGPNLAERSVDRSLVQFAAAMWNKAPAMNRGMRARGISVPALTAGEMADIVAYLYSVRYFRESGSVQAGRTVIRSKGCLDCHSLGGIGGRQASDLEERRGADTPTEAIAEMWRHFGLEVEAGRASPAWSVLRPEEMAGLAAFLQSGGGRP